jgi:phosphate transport system substrate-binding protein
LLKYIKRGILPLALVLIVAIAFVGCSSEKTTQTTQPSTTTPSNTTPALSGSFKIIGSNTVTPLSAVWSETFMKANPEVSIAVSGPGSGVGIAALIDGTTDICQASRLIKSSEIEMAEANGVQPYEIQVASDALSVIVHPDNPVTELTIAQLSAIYTNQITNWKEVGGNDAPIVVMARDTNSGTHVFFKEHVVQMYGLDTADKTLEYGDHVLLLPSTEEGVSQVASNPNGIFYAGLGYVNDTVKAIGVKKTADDIAVQPSVETALDGTYAIARPLLYYTNGEPTGLIKAYIDYCLSATGQEEVLAAGFVPLA